jgi:hypothetical protein
VLLPLISSVQAAGDLKPMQIVSFTLLAFQNGFFWQAVLDSTRSGINPSASVDPKAAALAQYNRSFVLYSPLTAVDDFITTNPHGFNERQQGSTGARNKLKSSHLESTKFYECR